MHQNPVQLSAEDVFINYYLPYVLGTTFLLWKSHTRVQGCWHDLHSELVIILHCQYLFITYNKQEEGPSPLPIPIQNSMLGVNFSLSLKDFSLCFSWIFMSSCWEIWSLHCSMKPGELNLILSYTKNHHLKAMHC